MFSSITLIFWAACSSVFFVVFIVISGFNGGSYGCPIPGTVGALLSKPRS